MERNDFSPVIFGPLLRQALGGGLVGLALVDKFGTIVDLDGDISEDEAQPLAALIMFTLKGPDLADRLFAGDVLTLELDGREVALAIAKRKLFVVAVLKLGTTNGATRVGELRDQVARHVGAEDPGERFGTIPPWGNGGGAGGAGPAELPLTEWGISIRRDRGKA